MGLLSKTAREFFEFRKRAAADVKKAVDGPEPSADDQHADSEHSAQVDYESKVRELRQEEELNHMENESKLRQARDDAETEEEARRLKEEAKMAQAPQDGQGGGGDVPRMAPPNPLGNPPPGLPRQ